MKFSLVKGDSLFWKCVGAWIRWICFDKCASCNHRTHLRNCSGNSTRWTIFVFLTNCKFSWKYIWPKNCCSLWLLFKIFSAKNLKYFFPALVVSTSAAWSAAEEERPTSTTFLTATTTTTITATMTTTAMTTMTTTITTTITATTTDTKEFYSFVQEDSNLQQFSSLCLCLAPNSSLGLKKSPMDLIAAQIWECPLLQRNAGKSNIFIERLQGNAAIKWITLVRDEFKIKPYYRYWFLYGPVPASFGFIFLFS